MFVELFRFTLSDNGPDGQPCWCAPEGCQGLIDLVPPGQDSDPDVNFAIGLFDSALDSESSHHRFGSANVTELQLDAVGRDAWESVTGYRPASSTVAAAIAEHLLTGSDPTGQEFTRPLTAGRSRQLDVYLGGRIWSHTLADWSDPLALPVMRAEAVSLAAIFRDEGETQYRLAMGGIHRKYQMYGPVKHLIEWLYPAGRDDLPLLDELWPQTLKIETWPGAVSPTTGQDNTWSVSSGAWLIPSAGSVRNNSAGISLLRLDYVFGGNDRHASCVFKSITGGRGMLSRSDSTGANSYLGWQYNSANCQAYKIVTGSATLISTASGSCTLNDVLQIRTVGSNHSLYRNGADISSGGVTDTAVASGTYSFVRGFEATAEFGQIEVDDTLIGGGSNRRRRVIMTGGGQ